MLFGVNPQPFQEFHSNLLCRLKQRRNLSFIVHPYKDSLCLLCGFLVLSLGLLQAIDNQQKAELCFCNNARRSFSIISIMILRRPFGSPLTMSACQFPSVMRSFSCAVKKCDSLLQYFVVLRLVDMRDHYCHSLIVLLFFKMIYYSQKKHMPQIVVAKRL